MPTFNLILNYSYLNITVDGKDIKKTFTASPMDYKIQVQSRGNNQIIIMCNPFSLYGVFFSS